MTDTRSYSVTPRTLCIRFMDGTRQVILCDRPMGPEGTFGYILGGSFCAPGGEWVRTWEHPQESDQFLHDGEADEDAMASAGMGEDESYGYYGGGDE